MNESPTTRIFMQRIACHRARSSITSSCPYMLDQNFKDPELATEQQSNSDMRGCRRLRSVDHPSVPAALGIARRAAPLATSRVSARLTFLKRPSDGPLD